VREIALSRGMIALVDDEDHSRLAAHKWSYHPLGYAVRQVTEGGRPRLLYMHREILQAPQSLEVDHRSGDGLDNQRENLRLARRAQNARNQRLRPHSSQFKGVSWARETGRWHAAIMVDYRRIYLGSYLTEEEAAVAYDLASRELHGEYGRRNFDPAALHQPPRRRSPGRTRRPEQPTGAATAPG
jgi:hypothetical protein